MQPIAKIYSGYSFSCKKSRLLKTFCRFKQCYICKKFGHNKSKCLQKSKMDEKIEKRTFFSQSCEFSDCFCSDGAKNQVLIFISCCTIHMFCGKDFLVDLLDVSWISCLNAEISVSTAKGKCVAKTFLTDKRGVSAKAEKKIATGNVLSKRGGVSQHICEACGQMILSAKDIRGPSSRD